MALRTVVSLLAGAAFLARVHADPTLEMLQQTCRTEFGFNYWLQVISKTTSTSLIPTTVSITKVYTTTSQNISYVTPSTKATETSVATATLLTTITLPVPPDTYTTTDYATLYHTTNFSTTPVETVTTTNTSTIYATTSTIGTPPGFTPIAALPAVSAQRRGIGHPQLINQAAPHQGAPVGGRVVLNSDAQPSYAPVLYPSVISCNVLVATVTTTNNPFNVTTTITKSKGSFAKASTTWLETTSTSTVTTHSGKAKKTITAHVTSTIVHTKTVANTTYVTTTTYQTLSVPLPTSTYAACAPNNLLSQPKGVPIVEVDFPQDSTSLVGVASAYECCVVCQESPNCGGSFYLEKFGCNIITVQGCDGSQDFGNTFRTGTLDTTKFKNGWYANFTVSNGPCGQLSNAGWSHIA